MGVSPSWLWRLRRWTKKTSSPSFTILFWIWRWSLVPTQRRKVFLPLSTLTAPALSLDMWCKVLHWAFKTNLQAVNVAQWYRVLSPVHKRERGKEGHGQR